MVHFHFSSTSSFAIQDFSSGPFVGVLASLLVDLGVVGLASFLVGLGFSDLGVVSLASLLVDLGLGNLGVLGLASFLVGLGLSDLGVVGLDSLFVGLGLVFILQESFSPFSLWLLNTALIGRN